MVRFDLSALRSSLTAAIGATLLSVTCLAGALAPARADVTTGQIGSTIAAGARA